ncbi:MULTISPECIES: glycoside hydrolase family 3 N-terminal domain-containing protein [unclassified Imperialibacter]|uniref:glycoside hydrolase family 3 protein n=1 Tax=unclassified Imperialibacter TaxID=2629706 RepID=UPI00125A7E75|nr:MULTISPECIES: glycoside hydrolase family 3 N-terminal domain-containing protein [unclassified Imperialibacter]CAD5266018.1 Beta-hexosaminidase [Imperialibacter sp. 75]CAD5292505.1 Beta-hexosaminidase [Imperialibacter sp. 89]VVT17497.1 Beta-hexosaminidase [Imperialibacter sp. EC-SDR9]
MTSPETLLSNLHSFKKSAGTYAALLLVAFLVAACTEKPSYTQPELGTRSAPLIEADGYQFKDLNKNGALDKYEDWRLPPEERSSDLLSKMSLEEKAGFMVINSLSMLGSRKAEMSGGQYAASDLDEGQVKDDRPANPMANFIGGMNAATSTMERVKDFHNRHFILRLNEPANVIAEWNNKLQELCETEPLGIPAIITSNPRNHISSNASVGTALDATVFTAWPGELGLSATRDLPLIREFAEVSHQEWRAAGIRKGYMYMADVATEPRWSRVNGTFGENPEWVAQITKEVVLGFQGQQLGAESIALTMKHFPGGGSGKGGQDSHFDWGKEQVFPGGRFYDNILPFKAAIDAGVSSIMPYYSMPVGTKYEEVGYAFNKSVITDVLRGEFGFKGIVNTDTGPLTRMVWGVEDLTLQERYKKALEAGSNIISGVSDPADLIEVVNSGMVDISLIDRSVSLLLKEKFELGIFENPYVDPAAAEKIVGNSAFREKASLALRKSIVMLRNENGSLPIQANTKIYFETIESPGRGQETGKTNVLSEISDSTGIELVATPDEADLAVQWVIPSSSLFNSDGAPISLSLSKTGIDVSHINKIASGIPTILVIDYSNPWVINEVFNEENKVNIVGVLATFGTTPEALLDVITGKFNPAGKMPFSTPISDEAVTNNLEDVPGYLEAPGYALFNYDEGLSYKK